VEAMVGEGEGKGHPNLSSERKHPLLTIALFIHQPMRGTVLILKYISGYHPKYPMYSFQ